MSIALSEFWSRLVRGGIVDAAGCKRLANAFADAKGTPASDVATLAQFLVETNELTEFQARCLTSPTAVEIRYGDFVQRTDSVTVPLSHWLPVRRVADRQDGFLIRVGPNQFTESRRQWLEAHAAVDLPSLQPFELRGDIASGIDVFSALPEGRCLSEITATKMKVERSQALTVGIAVADALAAMHERSLVHGAVCADRVWLAAGGQTVLLRDPSGPPAAPRDNQSAAWIDVMESPGAYAAPEFADPSFACNTLTDIYSLGCLLFRMVAGRLPFAGQTIEAEIAAHVSEVPPELSAAIQQGEAGDPVLRVIAYVMAKNPAARFATARQVSDALKAVLAMTSDVAASKSKVRAAPPPSLLAESDQPAAPPPAKQQTSVIESPTTDTLPKTAPAAASSTEPPEATSAKTESSLPVESRKSVSARPPKVESPPPVGATKPPRNKDAGAQQPAKPPKSAPATKTATKPAAEPPPAAKQQTPPVAKQQTPPVAKQQTPPVAKQQTPPVAKQQTTPVAKQQTTSNAAPRQPPPPPRRGELPEPKAKTLPEPETMAAFAAAETVVRDADASDEGSRVRRRRKRKKNNLPFVFGILSVPVLLFIIMLIVQGLGGDKPARGPAALPNPARIPTVGQARKTTDPPSQQPAQQPATAPQGFELVEDDRLLWVPPYAADSSVASLELLPPGPAVVVSVQLAKLLQDPVGREMIDGLSPELTGLIDVAAQRARVPAESIERCTLALHAGQEGWPVVSLAIELVEPLPLKSLTDRWQVSASRTPDGATVYAGEEADGDVYFLGDSEQGAVASDASVKRFAVGPLDQIREVAANEGGEIPLPRLSAKVWSESSAESDLVMLITPNFLFADGREMLLSTAPELVDPLRSVLIPDVAALLISAKSIQQDVYAEMRVVPSGDVSEPVLLRKISDAFQSWPAWADTFIVDSVPDASWRLLATRMPLMLRFLVDHTRFGVSDGTVVANAYLPGNAASQIALSTLLAMNTTPGGPAVSVATSTKPLTVDEMLARKMTIAFDQESLEFGINVIVDQFKDDLPAGSTMPPVRIVGGDLEKAGITQNQQIRDFSKKDLPLRTVLTDLLLGANPDKTATGPADPKQALVWVLSENADVPGGTEILVTTRAASEGVHQLPAEFKAQPQ